MTNRVTISQRGPSDSSVACAAMATGLSYDACLAIFESLGLAERRRSRQPYSASFSELELVLKKAGATTTRRRYTTWADLARAAIVKTDPSPQSKNRDWHWVYIERDSQRGLLLRDPAELPWWNLEKLGTNDFTGYCFEGFLLEVFPPTVGLVH